MLLFEFILKKCNKFIFIFNNSLYILSNASAPREQAKPSFTLARLGLARLGLKSLQASSRIIFLIKTFKMQ